MSNGTVKPDPEHRWDKLALFLLAALVVVVLGLMVIGVFWRSVVPDKGDVLLGGISTGLILFLQKLVDAVKASWEEVTRGKTMDTLATANTGTGDGAPQDAAEGARKAADAADKKAAQIEKQVQPETSAAGKKP